jgi:hypothetical protein
MMLRQTPSRRLSSSFQRSLTVRRGLANPASCLVRGAATAAPRPGLVVSLRPDTSPGVYDLQVESDPVGDRVSVPTALSMRSSLRSAGVLPLTA